MCSSRGILVLEDSPCLAEVPAYQNVISKSENYAIALSGIEDGPTASSGYYWGVLWCTLQPRGQRVYQGHFVTRKLNGHIWSSVLLA